MPRFLSISEAADALKVSPRQIRHLGLGTTRTAGGNARIFDAADVTVLRVYVELAKRFGSEESGAFVNGVLGRVADDCGRAPEPDPAPSD